MTRLHKQLSLEGVGVGVGGGGGWGRYLLTNSSVFTVVILSLLTANQGTLFVKRRTGFLTYADDPKVSVTIRGSAVNLLFARTRRLDRDASYHATTIIQSLKIIFDVCRNVC